MFTVRYELNPYIKQTCLAFKELNTILSITPYRKHNLTKLPVSLTISCAPNLATLPLYALQLVTVCTNKNTLYLTLHVKYKVVSC